MRRSTIWMKVLSAMACDDMPATFILHAYISRSLPETDAQRGAH